MIASLDILILVLAIVVPVYWLLPRGWEIVREIALIAVSMLLVFAMSPVILLWLVPYYLLAAGLYHSTRLGLSTATVKALSWGLFLPLIFFEFVPSEDVIGLLGWQSPQNHPDLQLRAFLGASYCAIRSFLIVREGLARKSFAPVPSLLTMTFFGSYVAGPIAGSNPFVRSAIADRLTIETSLVGLSRIGWGAALLLVIKPALVEFELSGLFGPEAGTGTTASAWLEMYKEFFALYFDFLGYSHTAIGIALLFGVTLPENFHNPLAATSMQEFWQRWHMSLGIFISTYLFKPLVRSTGRPEIAVFLAFAVIGLWHRVTWTYFIWGLGHGTALMLNMIWKKRTANLLLSDTANRVTLVMGWAATMTWVAFLSTIANAPSLADAGRLAVELAGFD